LADVIAFPTAAVGAAVYNRPRRGRYPKGVASLAAQRRRRAAAQLTAADHPAPSQAKSIDEVIDALQAMKRLGLIGGVAAVVETPDGQWRQAAGGTLAGDGHRFPSLLDAIVDVTKR
jgi:hypothetical protein